MEALFYGQIMANIMASYSHICDLFVTADVI